MTENPQPEKPAYIEWNPKTLLAYQQTITEIVRVQRINANFLVTATAFMRVCLDKNLVTQEEIANYIPAAQQQGLGLIGLEVSMTDETDAPVVEGEVSAEERFQQEGLKVWDGIAKSLG